MRPLSRSLAGFSSLVLATIEVLATPFAYITSSGSDTVSVIDTATNAVVATVAVGHEPFGVAVNAAGTRVYVGNRGSNNVSVIDAIDANHRYLIDSALRAPMVKNGWLVEGDGPDAVVMCAPQG